MNNYTEVVSTTFSIVLSKQMEASQLTCNGFLILNYFFFSIDTIQWINEWHYPNNRIWKNIFIKMSEKRTDWHSKERFIIWLSFAFSRIMKSFLVSETVQFVVVIFLSFCKDKLLSWLTASMWTIWSWFWSKKRLVTLAFISSL